MHDIESCPTCGALPCDWVNNPHEAASARSQETDGRSCDVLREALQAVFNDDDFNSLGQIARRHVSAALSTFSASDHCPKCGDSGYIETSSGGHWTGENVRVTQTLCDCPCGDDARDQENGTGLHASSASDQTATVDEDDVARAEDIAHRIAPCTFPATNDRWLAAKAAALSAIQSRDAGLREALEEIRDKWIANNSEGDDWEDDWEDGFDDGLKVCHDIAHAALTEGGDQ